MQHDTHNARSQLPILEDALLWSVRVWAIGYGRKVDVTDRIHDAFAELRVPEAALHLDGFMRALCRGARRTLEIDCACQPRISADELLILDVFALQQEAYEDEAHALMGRILHGDAVSAGCGCALGLVLTLNMGGHYLPRGAEAVRRHAFCHRLGDQAVSVSPSLLH